MKTIFVSIASYKDTELVNTVNCLLNNAKYPDRLVIGICQQDAPDQFITFSQPQVKVVNFHYVASQGVCWARRHAQGLYNDEDYFLQIDSHIIMVPEWDEILVQQIDLAKQLTTNKVLFAAYPSGYQIVNEVRRFDSPGHSKTILRNDDFFRFHCGSGMPSDSLIPTPTPFLNAGFLFGDGVFNRLCLYDPDIYFEGEELLNTVKAYTHGFDLFNPSSHMCWHLYKLWSTTDRSSWKLHHNDEDDIQRPIRHWQRDKQSYNKLIEIFSGQRPEELGQVRSLKDYEHYIGRSLLKEKYCQKKD